LRASARTALPVSAVVPATSSRSSTIWNASPRFFAYAPSAAMGSAAAPVVRAPHARGGDEQRARLAAVDPFQRLESDRLIGRLEVERLSADQP
jgi:hypothetical protein